jgi:hypothetical protein
MYIMEAHTGEFLGGYGYVIAVISGLETLPPKFKGSMKHLL